MSHHSRNLIRVSLLILCIASTLVFVFNHTSAQNPPPAPQTTAPTEQTVEQAQKNIQVFKGLPESQLIPVMNYMSASLGVRCNFCHVNKDGNWDYPSDDKPEKNTAREMIAMVTGINKNNFRGN